MLAIIVAIFIPDLRPNGPGGAGEHGGGYKPTSSNSSIGDLALLLPNTDIDGPGESQDEYDPADYDEEYGDDLTFIGGHRLAERRR